MGRDFPALADDDKAIAPKDLLNPLEMCPRFAQRREGRLIQAGENAAPL
jgi:hypothetical protein